MAGLGSILGVGGALGIVLAVLFFLLLPVWFLIAVWRIGSALHRIANGLREAVWLQWPGSRPDDHR